MKKALLSIFVLSTFCLSCSMEDKRDFVEELRHTEEQTIEMPECPICFETYDEAYEPVVLKCNHVLCRECAEKMINHQSCFCGEAIVITDVSLQMHLANTYNPDEDKEVSCSLCEKNFRRGEEVDRNACSKHIFHDVCVNGLIEEYFERRPSGQCPHCNESIVLNLFFQAIENRAYENVKNFIELGIDVDAKKDWHKTALMVASEYGYLELVALLIEKNADVNAQAFSCTALILAAKNGHTKIVDLLIKNGANIEARDFFGNSALSYACLKGNTEMAELLKQL